MKVKCIENTSKGLFRRTLATFPGITLDYEPLAKKEEYEVYGISLWMGCLHYLIVDRYKGVEQNPSLYPAELFKVIDSRLPQGWYYQFAGTEEENEATWGYKEFVMDPKHHEELYGIEAKALDIFFKRRKEMDDSLEV